MLSRPEHGWSTVTIGRHKLDVSYIEPAAEMLVTTLIRALTCKEASVTFDAEGWHWRLDFSGDETRLTLMSSVTKTHVIPMTAREMAREVLGDLVYGKDEPSLEAAVVKLLAEKGLTLGCAESCTGGLFAKRLTDVPGASRVFRGGVVSYTNEVKSALLGVDPALLEEKGAVSPEVAQAMALGARKALGCDLAISFTGVAGPGPDDRGNPEGLVFAALAYGDEVWVRRLSGWRDRDRIRTMAVSNGLDMIRRMVLGLERK
jgi:PncC family amidohydrolase